jgi:hypothetical protein
MTYNVEKKQDEVINNFKCFYAKSLEAICIILEQEIKYFNLTQDIILNLLEFSKNVGAKNVLLLLDRKNSEYGKF